MTYLFLKFFPGMMVAVPVICYIMSVLVRVNDFVRVRAAIVGVRQEVMMAEYFLLRDTGYSWLNRFLMLSEQIFCRNL